MADHEQKHKLLEKQSVVMPERKRVVVRRLATKNTGIEEPDALERVDSATVNDANSTGGPDCKVVRHCSNDAGQEYMYLMKLEATRRKLKERNVEIKEAGRKKKIRIIDFNDVSEQVPPSVEPRKKGVKIVKIGR